MKASFALFLIAALVFMALAWSAMIDDRLWESLGDFIVCGVLMFFACLSYHPKAK